MTNCQNAVVQITERNKQTYIITNIQFNINLYTNNP